MKSAFARDILARMMVSTSMLEQFILENLKDERPLDLTITQVLALYWLYKQGGTLHATKMRDMCYGGTNLSYNLNAINKAKYVSRKRSKEDLRHVAYQLTPKGLNVAKAVDAIVQKVESEIGDRFNAKNMRDIEEWLAMIGHDFKRDVSQLKKAV